MMIVTHLDEIPPTTDKWALTIGSFDGVHLGHLHLIEALKKEGKAAVVTFRNHPVQHFKKTDLFSPITTLEEKLDLLEKAGVDLVILLEFNDDLLQKTYTTFLDEIRARLPFSSLVLGTGAAFGKGRAGDEKHVQVLAKARGFKAIYLPKFTLDGETISSGKIRDAIRRGDFEHASKLLGRKIKSTRRKKDAMDKEWTKWT